MKKIGILGSGIVATTLAEGFINQGYDVMLGTRNLNYLAEWQQKSTLPIKIGNFNDTASYGEIIVLAIKGIFSESVLKTIDSKNLKSKIIIDTTNPIDDKAPVNGVIHFFTNLNDSLMERLQKSIPEAHFVKAFNSIGAFHMVNPRFNGTKPSMFICGNNLTSKQEVSEILTQFGWEAEDMGNVESARAIEPLCILWCIRGFKDNQWSHAFKLLKN